MIRREMTSRLRLILFLFLLISFIAVSSCKWVGVGPTPRERSFRVIDVADDGVIELLWLEPREFYHPEFSPPKSESTGRETSRMQLLGIWSVKEREPYGAYENRARFLKEQLLNKTVKAHTHRVFPVILAGGGEEAENAKALRPGYEEIGRELWLEDGQKFNELVLEKGYAIFDFVDFDSSKGLFSLTAENRQRYEAAEAQARNAALGIWSLPDSVNVYQNIEHLEKLKHSGAIFYVLTQVFTAFIVLLLIYLARRDPKSTVVPYGLLWLPLILLLPELLRTFGLYGDSRTSSLSDIGHVLGLAKILYLVLVLGTIVLVVTQLFRLVAYGPLQQWGELWLVEGAWFAIARYFVLLWSIALLFGVIFYLSHCGGFIPSIKASFSNVLKLGYAPLTAFRHCKWISQLEAVAFFLLPFTLLYIPEAKTQPSEASVRTQMLVSISSVLIILLVIASVFTNLYFFNIDLNGFNVPLDRIESFFFALAPIRFGSYEGVYATSKWMLFAQVVEVHLALFMGAIGLRSINAIVGRAIRAGTDGGR
jgi:hypothetical protein